MAEAHESVTEVDDNDGKDKSRRRRFGLGRKEDPKKEVRSETEWVDTLVAHPEGEEEPLAGSPLAAGEEEEEEAEAEPLPEVYEAAPVREGEGELPEDVAEVGDEYLIRERQLYRPDKLALENRVRSAHTHKGDRDAFYEKSWTRRTEESHEDIRNFVDNVLGTELDPSRRRERRERAGLPRRTAPQESAAATVHVEGLGRDVLIAFTFPKEEFRSARVVYETEGGYVVEVARAVGNDDARLETQYYTVSRIGEVGHVLDKMRAHEAERRAREEGVEPIAPLGGPEPEEAEERSDAPPQAPPTPEDVGAPGAPEEGKGLEEAVEEQRHEDAQVEETETEEESRKKGFGGMFKRKKGDQGPEAPEPKPAEESPEAPEGPESESEEGGKKKGFGGLFKRKKGDEESDEGDAEAPPQQGEGTDEEENQA